MPLYKEGIAISRGEIPAKRFSSFEEMLEDLNRDDSDDESSADDELSWDEDE